MDEYRNIDIGLDSEIKLNKIKVDGEGLRYLDDLLVGKYSIHCLVLLDDILYKSNELNFLVTHYDNEKNILFRNEDAMREISLKSKGNYCNIENYKDIISSIYLEEKYINKKIEISTHTFHNYWFILLITLIIEWFLRKRKGLL